MQNYGDNARALVSGYRNNAGTYEFYSWNLYKADEIAKTTITAKAVGTTTATIGKYDYTIKVVEEFEGKDLVVDFDLPATVSYREFKNKIQDAGATYGKVDVSYNEDGTEFSVTYTPTKVMTGVDTVYMPDNKGNMHSFKVYPATSMFYDASFAEYTPAKAEIPWNVQEGNVDTSQTASLIGDGDHYGYEANYNNTSSAASVTVGDSASFAFAGTGVDVYGNSKANGGMVLAQVKTGETVEKMALVDTQLNVEGKGTGFRVYETLGEPEALDETVANVYKADGEYAPTFVNMRDKLIALSAEDAAQTANTEGGVEVILYKDQALVFSVTNAENLQLGLRSLTGTEVIVTGSVDEAVSSDVDMFYNVSPTNGTVTITNTSDGILAITKLKSSSFGTAPTAVTFNALTPEDRAMALVSLGHEPGDSEEPSKELVTDVFNDVVADAWYEDEVQYVYDNELMSGHNKAFRPDEDMTRAEFITVLYRIAGSPEVNDKSIVDVMADVVDGEWYADAVCWAYANHITKRTSDTTFGTNEAVTREQVATFLHRYAGKAGLTTTQVGDLSGLLNADKVSEFAEKAIEWAVGAGLIKGSSLTGANGEVVYDLAPQGNTTHAQMAAILMRFCEAYAL